MKKIAVFSLFFLFIWAYSSFAGLRVGYLSPSSPAFETFSSSFLNGLYLGLSKDETVVIQNTSQGVNKALENLYLMGADVVIGPFEAASVKTAQNEICSSGVVTILPFAKADYSCPNLFSYTYNPISAALELAKLLSSDNLGKTLVLYAYDNLDIAKKDAFLEGLGSENAQIEVKGFQKSNSYDKYIKSLFGVWKIRHKSSLTNQPVYKHSLNIETIVIFAPQRDFVDIANLLDYYGILVKAIYSTDIVINNNLLSLSKTILKRLQFITPYYLCSEDGANANFVKQYDTEYQQDPNFMSALGYDIGRLLNGDDRVSVQSKLKETADFDGLIGTLLFFDDNGNGFINYKLLNYKDIKKCKAVILNK